MHRGICLWLVDDTLCHECGQNTFRRLVFWVENDPKMIDGYCTNRKCNPVYQSSLDIDELRRGELSGFSPIIVFEAQLCSSCNGTNAVLVFRGNDFLASECPDCKMGAAPTLDRRPFKLRPPQWRNILKA
ncbi:MAG: hypothetical protein RDU25_05935 [Patescibacteria group bacterium]|nr:hypothetical protein [Patescibacteria group bacterium]